MIAPPPPDGEVIHPLSEPIHELGGIAVLQGSLAPKGAVVKVAGIDFDEFEGPARVFDGEDAAMEAVLGGRINAGDVVVIRYEGPKGGPGMREMLAITGAMKGAGRGGDAALITDGRFSGRHPRLLHRPRGPRGGRRRARSPWWPRVTGSGSTCGATPSTCWWTTPRWRPAGPT